MCLYAVRLYVFIHISSYLEEVKYIQRYLEISPQPGNGRGRERDGITVREGCRRGAGTHLQFPHSRLTPSPKNGTFEYIFALAIIIATKYATLLRTTGH